MRDTRPDGFAPPSGLRECGNPAVGGIPKRGGRLALTFRRLVFRAFHGAPLPQAALASKGVRARSPFAIRYIESRADLKSVTNHVNEYSSLTHLRSLVILNRPTVRGGARVQVKAFWGNGLRGIAVRFQR